MTNADAEFVGGTTVRLILALGEDVAAHADASDSRSQALFRPYACPLWSLRSGIGGLKTAGNSASSKHTMLCTAVLYLSRCRSYG
jgi:hypothetical protein